MSQPSAYEPVLGGELEGLSVEQAQAEAALREVGATMLNIEQAIRRADQARKAIARGSDNTNFLRALDDAIAELERTRRTLQQQTYFAQPQQRLI